MLDLVLLAGGVFEFPVPRPFLAWHWWLRCQRKLSGLLAPQPFHSYHVGTDTRWQHEHTRGMRYLSSGGLEQQAEKHILVGGLDFLRLGLGRYSPSRADTVGRCFAICCLHSTEHPLIFLCALVSLHPLADPRLKNKQPSPNHCWITAWVSDVAIVQDRCSTKFL